MGKWGQVTSWLTVRRRVLALALLGWVGLIVVSGGQKPEGDQRFALPDLGDILTGTFLLVMVCSALILPFIVNGPRMEGGPRKRQSIWGIVLLVAVGVALLAFVDLENLTVPPAEEEQVAVVAVPEPDSSSEPTERDSALLLIVALAVAGGVLLWTRRRLATTPNNEGALGPDAEIGRAINTATNQLLHGDDPRSSVLAAYATLETSLAKQGQGRKSSETPAEHLGRALAKMPRVAEPAITLGRLYEIARFSDHTITAADQQLAASQLDQAGQHLESNRNVAT